MHRLGLEYHKPDTIPRKLDEEKQKAFIESYNKLLNSLTDNEAVVFADDKRMSAITTSTAARDERLADVIQFLAHGLTVPHPTASKNSCHGAFRLCQALLGDREGHDTSLSEAKSRRRDDGSGQTADQAVALRPRAL